MTTTLWLQSIEVDLPGFCSARRYYLDLTEIIQKNCIDSSRVKDELQLLHLNQTLHPSTRCIIESIQHLPLAEGAPNLQASKLALGECTRLLDIDFDLDKPHRWVLKNEQKSV
jgi:hypothetical protein